VFQNTVMSVSKHGNWAKEKCFKTQYAATSNSSLRNLPCAGTLRKQNSLLAEYYACWLAGKQRGGVDGRSPSWQVACLTGCERGEVVIEPTGRHAEKNACVNVCRRVVRPA